MRHAHPLCFCLQVLSSITGFLPPLTVGLVATLTSVACIIAADTGAYFVGKNLGRTKLTDISPKKTVEGAIGGCASAIATAVLFWKVFSWPGNVLAAAGYAVSGNSSCCISADATKGLAQASVLIGAFECIASLVDLFAVTLDCGDAE